MLILNNHNISYLQLSLLLPQLHQVSQLIKNPIFCELTLTIALHCILMQCY